MKTVWIESNRIALLCECKTMSYHKKVNFMTTIMEESVKGKFITGKQSFMIYKRISKALFFSAT
jgi:hypothetical protein